MKTTIEWLEHILSIILNEEEFKKITYTIEQAKEMEKEQIIDAYQQGFNNAYFSKPLSKEQYYKETFNK